MKEFNNYIQRFLLDNGRKLHWYSW